MLEAKSIATLGLVRASGHEEKPLSEIIKEGRLAITPALAHRILVECGYDRQRNVRTLHASALAMQIREKEWTPGTQIHFARMKSDGWLRVVNGYHRLHAVTDANKTVEFQVLITECNTEDEVTRLYRRHDRLAIPRTVVDVLKAEALPQKFGLSVTLARGVFRAALLINAGLTFSGRQAKADPYTYRSDEARLRLCEPWWPIAEVFSDAVAAGQSTIRDHLSRSAGPLAVALLTLRDQEVKADAFWRGLANDDGLRRDDPRAAYIRFFHLRNSGRGAFLQAKAASLAWNAFFAGKKIAFVKPSETPIRLDGCDLG